MSHDHELGEAELDAMGIADMALDIAEGRKKLTDCPTPIDALMVCATMCGTLARALAELKCGWCVSGAAMVAIETMLHAIHQTADMKRHKADDQSFMRHLRNGGPKGSIDL